MKIYVRKTKKFLTLWIFTYMYEDDVYFNSDRLPTEQKFIGTVEDFKENERYEQTMYGAHYFNVKKKHATEEQYKEYIEGWAIC